MDVGKTSLGLYFLFVLWFCCIYLFINSETSDMGFCSRWNNRTGHQWASEDESHSVSWHVFLKGVTSSPSFYCVRLVLFFRNEPNWSGMGNGSLD